MASAYPLAMWEILAVLERFGRGHTAAVSLCGKGV